MAAQLNEALAAALAKGPLQIGQVRVERNSGGGFILSHIDDTPSAPKTHSSAESALAIARFDSAENFRPLKTAPNLRAGWVLQFRDLHQVGEALDYFYPGRLSVLMAGQTDRLLTTPLRSTLERQTGMYRAAANISDEQIDQTVAEVCRSDRGCLRTILWRRDASGALPSRRLPDDKFDPARNQAAAGEIQFLPLPCQEACAVLLEACRRKVRSDKVAAGPNE